MLYTFLSLWENSGRLTWVRLPAAARAELPVLQVHAGSFRIFVIHRTLTWTKRAYVIILMRVYTYGGWAHRQLTSQHNIFESEKLSQIFPALLTG